jgi:hypothetical protein
MDNISILDILVGIAVLFLIYVYGFMEIIIRRMPKWVERHPNVYKYFSIKEMECASLFPKKI